MLYIFIKLEGAWVPEPPLDPPLIKKGIFFLFVVGFF